MNDGAHMGVGAERALQTILGGEPSPGPGEQQSPEDVRRRVMAAPSPDGPQPGGYGDAADAIAKAFLTVRQEDPSIPLEMDALWDASKRRWPNFNDWLGGATGFQVGWAFNCVRWLMELPPAPNPAILEVEP